jgi:hypothetical protein
VTRIAFALAACIAAGPLAPGCAGKTAPPAPHARYTEPRWQDAFGDTPEVLLVIRPRDLKQDKVYGPLLRWGVERLREHSGVVAATPLEAIEDAEEVVIGMHPRTQGDEAAAADLVMVVVGVRADIDPGGLVDAGGHTLWTPGPNGPVRELVRERDERGLPLAASLFELPGRTWIMISGEGRTRAREAFAHPFEKPGMDLDPEALATVRIDGPSLVGHIRALQTLGAYAVIGRRLKALNLRLPPGASGEVQLALTYADEDAAAFAEVMARQVVESITRQKPDKLAWLARALANATVDRSVKRVVLKAPLPKSLIEVLLRARSGDVDL